MKLLSRVELVFLGVATVLHAGALFGAYHARGKNLLAERETAPLDLIEIEVERDPLTKEDVAEPRERQAAIHRTVTPRDDEPVDPKRDRHNPSSRGADRGSATNPGIDGADTGPGPTETSPTGDDGFSAPEDGGIPGLGGPGGPKLWQDPSLLAINPNAPPAPKETPKEKKADRDVANVLIKDLLRAKDKKLGLDLPAAGTVASIIKTAVQGSNTPGTAKATFAVNLGPAGNVTSIKVTSFAGGDSSMWNAVAANAKAALAARKLNLTEDYAKGAIIVVNAQSKMQMPSGAKVDAGIELSLTQNFDVADIGAKPVRQVVTSFSATPVK